MKKYKGGCHCGAVAYEVETDLAKVIECNCSHCHKKGVALNFVEPGSLPVEEAPKVHAREGAMPRPRARELLHPRGRGFRSELE